MPQVGECALDLRWRVEQHRLGFVRLNLLIEAIWLPVEPALEPLAGVNDLIAE